MEYTLKRLRVRHVKKRDSRVRCGIVEHVSPCRLKFGPAAKAGRDTGQRYSNHISPGLDQVVSVAGAQGHAGGPPSLH